MKTYYKANILKKIKPAFWDHRDISSGQSQAGFNFRRKWILLVVFTSFMALSPLFVMSLVELSLTRQLVEKEIKTSMQKTLESAALAISHTNDSRAFAIKYASDFDLDHNKDIFVLDDMGNPINPQLHQEASHIAKSLDISLFTRNAGVLEINTTSQHRSIITAYAKIPESTLTLVLMRTKDGLTELWLKPRLQLVGYLACSIIIILMSIMGTATYLINRIHSADRKRIDALHHAEHANKIASIGRLASGVAHEINNPLAIINQKTGLMLDLLNINEDISPDDRLIQLASDTLNAVTRCGTITRQLLDFARHMEPSIEPVNLEDVVRQMLIFLEKEAQRRNITFSIDNKTQIKDFHCDKGSLQQIFLNLFENSFAAMKNGGKLEVSIQSKNKEHVFIKVSDNGAGILEEDLNKIFEPFYSSKNEHWGTGLGLSITYGLVKELGGDIRVKSKLGKGTQFTIKLPLEIAKTKSIELDPTAQLEMNTNAAG